MDQSGFVEPSIPMSAARIRVAMSLTEGRTCRDLFYNGFLEMLHDAGADLTIFTEATRVTEFTETWRRPGVEFSYLYPRESSSGATRAYWIRHKLAQWNKGTLLRAYLKWEER